MHRDTAVRLAFLGLIAGGAVIYFVLDPEGSTLFPPCPFRWATGLFCPGCGSQRALHHLLHLRIGQAFTCNPALVVTLPLLALQWGLGRIRGAPFANDNRAVWAWGIALAAWGIFRNLPGKDLLAP